MAFYLMMFILENNEKNGACNILGLFIFSCGFCDELLVASREKKKQRWFVLLFYLQDFCGCFVWFDVDTGKFCRLRLG